MHTFEKKPHKEVTPRLPEDFESGNVFETVAFHDTKLVHGGSEMLASILLDAEKFCVRYDFAADEENKPYIETTSENPTILIERDASYCTLMLLADTEGNARLLHRPLLDKLESDTEPRDTDFVEKEIDYFFSSAGDVVNNESVYLLITATNPWKSSSKQLRTELVGMIKNHPYVKQNLQHNDIAELFVTPEKSRYLLPVDAEPGEKLLSNRQQPLPPMSDISTLVFVPRQLTKTGQNVIMAYSHQDAKEEEDTIRLLQKNKKIHKSP